MGQARCDAGFVLHREKIGIEGALFAVLLHQAAPGFERWFNHRPEVDDATRAAVLGL